jgi:hypothetical protein
MVQEMNKNKVKIELYKSKVMAKFDHYASGTLYYTVEMEDGKYQFPISTTEWRDETIEVPKGDFSEDVIEWEITTMHLSSDLGTTAFGAEIKAAELNRWIGKAIDGGQFIKVG